ncbi:MAG: D-alanyl-D-alanine carboxypeptidase [Oscillibacter sp.]|nr:D-alanyl-D-alanine carboxypeptidase [Oscillibacter sp.]
MIKTPVSRILTLILLVSFFPLSAPARALETSASAAILYDATTGQTLYEKNPDQQMLIASTTKIMTALVALRDGKLTDTVTVSRNAAGTEGSSMYLKAGETLTLEALLYGLMLSSGNDAAVAIAEYVAGSVPAFAGRMNEMARSLEMWNSSFANPHGLNHPEHYSTARDMAKLANAAMENETLRRITSTRTVTLAGRSMKNHNKLLGSLEGCIGLKTGYTKAAGRTLVTCCERSGRRLIAVTLKDGDDWNDHRKMYEYGFSTPWEPVPEEPELSWPTPKAPELPPVTPRNLTVMGNFLGEVPVTGGRWGTVPLIAGTTLGVQVPYGAEVDIRLELDRPLVAPVTLGTKVGVAVFLVNGAEWGRVDALCGEEVPVALDAADTVAPLSEEQLYGLEQMSATPEPLSSGWQSYEQAWDRSYGRGQSAPYWEQASARETSYNREQASARETSYNWEQASYNWEQLPASFG